MMVAQHRVLGGAMRCGKTTQARLLCTDKTTLVSSDAIRKNVRSQLTKDVRHPLFAWEEIRALKGDAWSKEHREYAQKLTDMFINESRSLEPYIRKKISESTGELLVEGSHILPKFAIEIADRSHIVYVIDSSQDQYVRIAKAQNKPESDYHYVEAWSHFNRTFGEYIQKQCKLYGVRCYDIADLGFEKTMSVIATTLTRK